MPGRSRPRNRTGTGFFLIKTLIVDDNANFRRSLSDMLRLRFPSMVVAHAETIAEALQEIETIRPGLVFVDIKLRDENGLDLTRKIRKSYPDTYVAVITSSNFPEYRQAAFDSGAQHFIPKGDSSSLAEILELIESLQSGRPPQWTLGANPKNIPEPRNPWKK